MDLGEAEIAIAKDQGVCPLGHPCTLVFIADDALRRACDVRHPTTTRYIGTILVDAVFRMPYPTYLEGDWVFHDRREDDPDYGP